MDDVERGGCFYSRASTAAALRRIVVACEGLVLSWVSSAKRTGTDDGVAAALRQPQAIQVETIAAAL